MFSMFSHFFAPFLSSTVAWYPFFLGSFFSPSLSTCLQLPHCYLLFFLSPTFFFTFIWSFGSSSMFSPRLFLFVLRILLSSPLPSEFPLSRSSAVFFSSFTVLTSYTTTSLPFRLHKMSSHIVIFLVKPFRDFLSRNERWLCLYFRTSFIFFEWPDVIIWTSKPLHQNSCFQAFVLTVSPTPDLNLKASAVK